MSGLSAAGDVNSHNPAHKSKAGWVCEGRGLLGTGPSGEKSRRLSAGCGGGATSLSRGQRQAWGRQQTKTPGTGEAWRLEVGGRQAAWPGGEGTAGRGREDALLRTHGPNSEEQPAPQSGGGASVRPPAASASLDGQRSTTLQSWAAKSPDVVGALAGRAPSPAGGLSA